MEVYPLPFEIISISSTLLPIILGIAVALTPQVPEVLGSSIVITGGVLYPLPGLVSFTLPTV